MTKLVIVLDAIAARVAAFVAGSDKPGSIHEELITLPHLAADGTWCCIERYWYEGGDEFAVSQGSDAAELCGIEDVPSVEVAAAAWRIYAQHVAETGMDPLHEYMAGEPTRVTDTYIVDVVADSASRQPRVLRFMNLATDGDAYYAVVSGALVTAAGSARIMPDWLRDYLGVRIHADGAIIMDDFTDLDGLMKNGHAARMWRLNDLRVRVLVEVEHWTAPEGDELARLKREAAAKHLAEQPV